MDWITSYLFSGKNKNHHPKNKIYVQDEKYKNYQLIIAELKKLKTPAVIVVKLRASGGVFSIRFTKLNLNTKKIRIITESGTGY